MTIAVQTQRFMPKLSRRRLNTALATGAEVTVYEDGRLLGHWCWTFDSAGKQIRCWIPNGDVR